LELVRRVRQISAIDDSLLGKSVMEPIQIISSPFPSASTIPYACQVVFDRRMVLGETRESVLDLHQKALQGMDESKMEFPEVTLSCYTGKAIIKQDFHPAWAVEPDSVWVQHARQGLESVGITPILYGTPYCTNGSGSAGEFGIPTVVFGPCSVHLAHVTDEYAEVSQLMRAIQGYIGLARSLGQYKHEQGR
jgi:acetylornithine deacetylase/succinyl-diaminopimelate desuccinylase-like protein